MRFQKRLSSNYYFGKLNGQLSWQLDAEFFAGIKFGAPKKQDSYSPFFVGALSDGINKIRIFDFHRVDKFWPDSGVSNLMSRSGTTIFRNLDGFSLRCFIFTSSP